MDAPERIWAWKEFDDDPRRKTWEFFWTPQSDGHPDLTEYVRADLVAAQLQEARKVLAHISSHLDEESYSPGSLERMLGDLARAVLAKSEPQK